LVEAKTNTTSAEFTYTISGQYLTPSNSNVTITAPSGFEISTTSGSGFSTTLNLPYAGSTLNSTTIYLRFAPTASASYSGSITNSGGSATTELITVSGVSGNFQIGDYGSVATTNWSTFATAWKRWDGAGWNTTATAAAISNTNVWKRRGFPITVSLTGPFYY